MPEIRSALSAHFHPGRFGFEGGELPLVLSEQPLGTLIQLSGWPDNFEQAATPVLQRLGFAGLGDFNHAQAAGGLLAFRIAPERVLLRLASSVGLESLGEAAQTPALDLSHSRTVLRVAGAAAADLLARGLPIDLGAAVFPAGRFVQSGIHSIGVMVHRLADDNGAPVFEIYVPRSYAVTIWEFLTESAVPFGYRISKAT